MDHKVSKDCPKAHIEIVEGDLQQNSGQNKTTSQEIAGSNTPQFKLYKRRYFGVVGIVFLSIFAGANLSWFGPIANSSSQTFDISLDQVNWLGNIVGCTYLIVTPVIPGLCSRYNIRRCYEIGVVFLVISAWVRFAGTARSLSPQGAYALLLIGQFLSSIPQVLFLVLAPTFSETWFDMKGRTTATMIMSIATPVGNAVGQLISPSLHDTRTSVLVLGILSTAVAPFVFLVGAKPPTPPSYAGSQATHSLMTTLRAVVGRLPHRRSIHDTGATMVQGETTGTSKETKEANVEVLDVYMTLRERIDFIMLTLAFTGLVSGVNTFSLLSNEILEPYGYSERIAGLMGSSLLLSGLVVSFTTSMLFDRVLTHHLGLAARTFVPIVAAAWLGLIWAARPHNTGALFAIFVIIGVCSISMLPIALELGCELTRNSGASSAILWFSANLGGIIFVLVMSALRASSSATPPRNMHRALIFNGATIFSCTILILFFRGRQRRREKDVLVAGHTL
ncbi:MFS general substrate transporter [Fomitiporia mediterranea MF3/22]|uniref:MFS general substrate transporter n=1 Tax=Fomitiporia mediterranea (strain MF3/22) TaxID=694068 RepID=UPI0004407C60|nr:MFS general substrate transporter [Fomitiporia mediterranea MF3/22]EJD00097.1 MFS general substrate transporter [Fomitiporia mediterranea MF3/22]